MVIKNLENKIRLVGIICTAFLVGCVIISLSSIWTARTMVSDAQKKVYVLDGNVPILVNRTTMDETLDMEAKSHVEMLIRFKAKAMAFFSKLFQSRTKKSEPHFYHFMRSFSGYYMGRRICIGHFPDYQEKRKHRIPHPCPIFPSECTCRQIHTRH